MLIFAIDDEKSALRVLHNAIAQAAPQAGIDDFSLGTDALRAMEEEQKRPDVVFCDIRMPRLDGLALAARIRTASPGTKVVFVTAYSEYAYDAFQLRASGYVMKPVTAESIRVELDNIAPPPRMPDGLWVRCFGNFEVFWERQPLRFARRQTKELLAYLIDREGALCTTEEIIGVLWEDEHDMAAAKNRLRQLIMDMKKALSAIGMEEILVRRNKQLAVRPDRIPCDYYRMLAGDMQWVNAWYGEYMSQYSWAEMTEGRLHFRK
jgi:two-component SAPR family response regulator